MRCPLSVNPAVCSWDRDRSGIWKFPVPQHCRSINGRTLRPAQPNLLQEKCDAKTDRSRFHSASLNSSVHFNCTSQAKVANYMARFFQADILLQQSNQPQRDSDKSPLRCEESQGLLDRSVEVSTGVGVKMTFSLLSSTDGRVFDPGSVLSGFGIRRRRVYRQGFDSRHGK